MSPSTLQIMDRRTYYARLVDLIALIVLGFLLYILTMIVIRWTIDFVTWSALDSGWAQAIGGTIGIAVAIWVPYNQSKQTRRRDAEVERESKIRLCLSLKDELEILSATFKTDNYKEVIRDAPDEIYDRLVPIPKERFPIYRALVGRLTELESPVLRKNIAAAYQVAQQVIELVEVNNNLLHALTALVRQDLISGGLHAAEIQRQHAQLCAVRAQLKNQASWTRICVTNTIDHLNRTVAALAADV